MSQTWEEYLILRFGEAELVEEQVELRMARGWQPLGGVSVAIGNHGSFYCQAMVRTREARLADWTQHGREPVTRHTEGGR